LARIPSARTVVNWLKTFTRRAARTSSGERENAALVERIHGVHRENRGVYASPRIDRGCAP
jgi:hypothetical protein